MTNHLNSPFTNKGIMAALGAALLFGLSTPFSKVLLGDTSPFMLAALLYLGSGAGLTLIRALRPARATEDARLTRKDLPWLAGALIFGGVLGPVLMLFGLQRTSGSLASLLLNMESVLTASIAWFVFHENFDRRIAIGMGAILAGGMILSFQGEGGNWATYGSFSILGACLCWGIDNNLSQKISASDPLQIAALKGLASGSMNLLIAIALGAAWPSVAIVGGSLLVGLLGYGLSLTFFVLALRLIGTARTSAYFSLSPFIGALVSLVLLREPFTGSLLVAGLFMSVGVWLHLTERHDHEHAHEYIEHEHAHVHDEHHGHPHVSPAVGQVQHSHLHVHPPTIHSHHHFPDIHHRHRH